VTASGDRDQRAALRRLQAAFDDVQVLTVHPTKVEQAPAGPALASRQLALTLPTPLSDRSAPSAPSNARLP
jgi:hypothetical protein